MNRHSIEIARHAERVRRYERRLKIREKWKPNPMIQSEQQRWYESLLEPDNFTSRTEKLRWYLR